MRLPALISHLLHVAANLTEQVPDAFAAAALVAITDTIRSVPRDDGIRSLT